LDAPYWALFSTHAYLAPSVPILTNKPNSNGGYNFGHPNLQSIDFKKKFFHLSSKFKTSWHPAEFGGDNFTTERRYPPEFSINISAEWLVLFSLSFMKTEASDFPQFLFLSICAASPKAPKMLSFDFGKKFLNDNDNDDNNINPEHNFIPK
jgi:hypothetical protein